MRRFSDHIITKFYTLIIFTFIFKFSFSQEDYRNPYHGLVANKFAIKFIPTSAISLVCPTYQGSLEYRIKHNKTLEFAFGYGHSMYNFTALFLPEQGRLNDLAFALDYRHLSHTWKPQKGDVCFSIGYAYFMKEFDISSYSSGAPIRIRRTNGGFNFKMARIVPLSSSIDLEFFMGFGLLINREKHLNGPAEFQTKHGFGVSHYEEGEKLKFYLPLGIKLAYCWE